MTSIDKEKFKQFVQDCMEQYRESIIVAIEEMKLENILQTTNLFPYLIHGICSPEQLVKEITDSRIDGSEKTKLGKVWEKIARHLAESVYDVVPKINGNGIDLEFYDDVDGIYYVVEIKSEPKWGNSKSTKQLKIDFEETKTKLDQSPIYNEKPINKIRLINGCVSGNRTSTEDLSYEILCGQDFWELISKERDFYTSPHLIDALLPDSTHMEKYEEKKASLLSRMTNELKSNYCDASGNVNYRLILKTNSENKELQKKTEIDNLIQDIRSIFVENSKKTTLDIGYIMSEVCVKLNVAIKDCASTKKLVKKTINENSPNIFVLKKNQVSIQGVI